MVDIYSKSASYSFLSPPLPLPPSLSVEYYTLSLSRTHTAPPTATVFPSLIHTVANQTLNFTLTPRCQAAGHPVPEVSWLRPDGSPQPSIQGIPQFGLLTRKDNGAFECIANNAAGRSSAQVSFVVEGTDGANACGAV